MKRMMYFTESIFRKFFQKPLLKVDLVADTACFPIYLSKRQGTYKITLNMLMRAYNFNKNKITRSFMLIYFISREVSC